jgi:hypothetical protein
MTRTFSMMVFMNILFAYNFFLPWVSWRTDSRLFWELYLHCTFYVKIDLRAVSKRCGTLAQLQSRSPFFPALALGLTYLVRHGGVDQAVSRASAPCLPIWPLSWLLVKVVGADAVACGEVKVVLVFDLVDVAKALVQLEGLSVASWKTSAHHAQVLEVEEVFLARVLRLLLGSFSLFAGGCLARAPMEHG